MKKIKNTELKYVVAIMIFFLFLLGNCFIFNRINNIIFFIFICLFSLFISFEMFNIIFKNSKIKIYPYIISGTINTILIITSFNIFYKYIEFSQKSFNKSIFIITISLLPTYLSMILFKHITYYLNFKPKKNINKEPKLIKESIKQELKNDTLKVKKEILQSKEIKKNDKISQSKKSISGMVLGIINFFCIILGPIAVVSSIIGLILSFKQFRKEDSKIALTGIILNLITMIISIFISIMYIPLLFPILILYLSVI